MLAGRLRHRVTIEHKVKTYNEFNEEIEEWKPFATVMAGVEPLRGREYLAAQQMQAVVDHRVVMRWRNGVLPTMRINFKGRIFEIVGPPINPDEKNRELHLMCRELM
jgi:SPP1 family predicted phage head-tail adaptor